MVKPLSETKVERDSSRDATQPGLRICDVVVDRLRREILVGDRLPGDRLPPERELADLTGTNRNTLREAIRTLENEHLVRARQGDGTVVLDYRREGELGLVPDFIREATPIEERLTVVRDLLALREQLLADAVTRAADHATDEEIAELRLMHGRLILGVGLEAMNADLAFFRCLLQATHSLVAIWTFNTFARTFTFLGRTFPEMWVFGEEQRNKLGKLVEHIAAHRPTEARATLRSLLRLTDAETAERLQALGPVGDQILASRRPRGGQATTEGARK